ncbi:GAF and ANTAR domain-containing protein [Nocardia sp. CDC153]|uniref:GAF and ANTAR domain-containing protein n=1 Tax=Nocardia sp. CDC153 TaxID=3112167 RepID=UPI002DB83BB2|nr:GAF and ANTAR domain-containing protein [Nocardia sp. CDC153]MEC3954533.1 GAF and ANTAR domain-containing protein [Nocardia sp. CDC153]
MSYDSSALIAALARFSRLLPTEYEPGDALDELVAAETEVLGLAGVGVAMVSRGRMRNVKSSSARVLAAERCQEQRQEGPCVDAHRSGEVVAVGNIAHLSIRWPRYAEVVRRDRIAAVAGIPMRLRDNPIGVVDLYGEQAGNWAESDLEIAQMLADTAVGYVVNADRRLRQHRLTEQLQAALESRVVIEQAKGVLANAYGITPDEAFALIRRHARTSQLRLQTVAHAIVESGLRV